MHRGYITFLKRIQDWYECDKVVFLGDIVDWASISYHPKAPSLKNSENEFSNAYSQVQQLYKAFPEATWLIGNHDCLTERHAMDVGLPLSVLKSYADCWDVQDWEVIPRFESKIIDGVIYQHGDRGRGGQINAAFLNAQDEHRPVVQGHFHAQFAINSLANRRHVVWGMQVGCGIDAKKAAMDYGKKFNKKPILGCGVVMDGMPYIERMKA